MFHKNLRYSSKNGQKILLQKEMVKMVHLGDTDTYFNPFKLFLDL